MKRAHAWLFCALGAAGAAGTGCFDYFSDPLILLQEPGPDALLGTGGTGGGTTTTIPSGCIPSNTDAIVDDTCGVFVSSSKGDDGNEGTKDEPFATIEKALGAAKGQPVYLCGETFAEAVELSAGALVYGALDCTVGWAYAPGKRSTIAPGADAIPLTVSAKASVELYDVDLTAADATVPGGSSIALLAQAETDVMLTRCDVTAGDGAAGVDGPAFDMPATAGGEGLPGADACTGAMLFGGASVKNTCAVEDSISGAGGVGQEASGGAGTKGQPGATQNGGEGEDDVMACTEGAPGDAGAAGTPGAGASGLGTLTSDGFTGVPGGDGQPGKIGQGGGGGGGAKGGAVGNACNKVSMAPGNAGASGGSGGAGGCGGAGGKGGAAGGSSIGIASLGAKLTFEGVKVTTKNGGKGGNGGPGQDGGPGGMGGTGGNVPAAATDLEPGCAGGPGGQGGAGGKGGGGLGGHSIAIAHTGEAPSTEGAQLTTGTAGPGGTGEGDMGNGTAGVTMPVRAF